ncbi:MAG: hypothetical protein Q8R25_04880 [bacterium]|nr:hypothetical protein [bacterium]
MTHHGSQVNIERRIPILLWRLAQWPYWWWFLAFTLLSATLFVGKNQLIDLYEDIALFRAPSAARAADFGERHLDARSNPALYDIDRAEYMYREAAKLDPTYPYVNHQLARIAFLKGNFGTAMYFINKEIMLHGDTNKNAYYVRGLIEGYKGDYDAAVEDYAHFLTTNNSWATMNDYAWVLLKAERYTEAEDITAEGLERFPDNPWLLNSHATALFELGEYTGALAAAKKAAVMVEKVTKAEWSRYYPGNDPRIAGEGIASFKSAIADNIHTIERALASSTVQPK